MKTTNERHKGFKARVLAGLLLGAVFLLSACGAEVNTVFDLNDGVKGTRTITATVSSEEIESHVTGGAKAIDASIRKHLPAELSYDGIKTKDENAQVVFHLKFDSEKDYVKKTTALLSASDSDTEPEIEILIEDSPFISGLAIKENFSSGDLIGWMASGLADDGVISQDNEGSVLSSDGEAEVRFDGKKYDSSNTLSVSEVKDDGFGQVKLQTTVAPDGTYAQEITYLMAEGRRASLGKTLDEFFAKATPAGGILDETFDTDSYADGWVLTFNAANLEELKAATNQALGSEKNSYVFEEAPAPTNPTLLRATLTGTADCAGICSPEGMPVEQSFVVPEAWNYVSGPSDASQSQGNPGEQSVTFSSKDYRLVFERSTPLQSMAVDTTLGFNGKVTQTFEYVVSAENVERVGTAFETVLAPNEDTGSFEVTAAGGGTTYKAVVEADSIEEYNSKIQSYLPGAGLEAIHPEGWKIWPEYTVLQHLPMGENLVSGGVTEAVETTIKLPAMHRFVVSEFADPSMEFAGSKLTVTGIENGSQIGATASGPALSGLIVLGILLVILFVAAVFVFIFRRKIFGATRKAWDKREAAGAAAVKLASSVKLSGAAVATGVAAATAASTTLLENPATAEGFPSAEQPRELFTESDLH